MLEIIQGHPGMVEATAFILPTNEHLHLRGKLGAMLEAVGGPAIQNDAIRKAASKLKMPIVPIETGATPYSRIYAVTVFPFKGGDMIWEEISHHLYSAIIAAYQEGHRKIAIPFFLDLPDFDPRVFGNVVGRLMIDAAQQAQVGKSDLHLIFVGKDEREAGILRMVYDQYLKSHAELRQAIADAVEAKEEEQASLLSDVPETPPKVVETPQKVERPKRTPTTKAATKSAPTSRTGARRR